MLDKYLVLLRMKYIEMFAYQLASLAWLAGAMIQPLITMMVWMNIDEAQTDYFIFYFATLIVVERMMGAWDVWELDREIREGTFSYSIVRPFHPIHWAIAENIVYKMLFLVVLLPAWGIAAIFVPALQIHLSGGQWVLFLLAVLLGAIARFAYSYIFGLFGFWITKVTAIYLMLEAVALFLSGRIAPLSLLPPFIKQISMYLPFRYMIGFPVEIATGALDRSAIAYGFLGAVAWALLFIVSVRWVWRAGLKKNQAMGG